MVIKDENLRFKFERKRIIKDKELPQICKDYKSTDKFGACDLSKICKNATYSPAKHERFGLCYGGTKESELKDRQRRLSNENWIEELKASRS